MEPHPNPERRWQNMRRMAWLSMIAGVAYPFVSAVTNNATLVDLATHFYAFVSLAVLAYMGFSTAGDHWGKR